MRHGFVEVYHDGVGEFCINLFCCDEVIDSIGEGETDTAVWIL